MPDPASLETGAPGTVKGQMEQKLARLAAAVSRRRRVVFAVWVVLLVAGGWFSLHQSDHLSGGGWEVPGSPSVRVTDAIQRDFPDLHTPAFTVFVTGGTPADVTARLREAHRIAAADTAVVPGPDRAYVGCRRRDDVERASIVRLCPRSYVGGTRA